MYLHEAIKASNLRPPCITRKLWTGDIDGELRAMVVLRPTDTPDGVLICADATRRPSRGWQPRLRELTVDDWIPADDIPLVKSQL